MKTTKQPKKTAIERQLEASKHERVICVDATKICKEFKYPGGKIRRGQIYRVAGTRKTEDGIGLLIQGRPVVAYDGEGSWKAERFCIIR